MMWRKRRRMKTTSTTAAPKGEKEARVVQSLELARRSGRHRAKDGLGLALRSRLASLFALIRVRAPSAHAHAEGRKHRVLAPRSVLAHAGEGKDRVRAQRSAHARKVEKADPGQGSALVLVPVLRKDQRARQSVKRRLIDKSFDTW